jgi:sialate O-acetylesterase
MKYSVYLLFLIVALALPERMDAGLRLPAFISSNMVLQQQQEVKIWGWSESGNNIKVKEQRQTAKVIGN